MQLSIGGKWALWLTLASQVVVAGAQKASQDFCYQLMFDGITLDDVVLTKYAIGFRQVVIDYCNYLHQVNGSLNDPLRHVTNPPNPIPGVKVADLTDRRHLKRIPGPPIKKITLIENPRLNIKLNKSDLSYLVERDGNVICDITMPEFIARFYNCDVATRIFQTEYLISPIIGYLILTLLAAVIPLALYAIWVASSPISKTHQSSATRNKAAAAFIAIDKPPVVVGGPNGSEGPGIKSGTAESSAISAVGGSGGATGGKSGGETDGKAAPPPASLLPPTKEPGGRLTLSKFFSPADDKAGKLASSKAPRSMGHSRSAKTKPKPPTIASEVPASFVTGNS